MTNGYEVFAEIDGAIRRAKLKREIAEKLSELPLNVQRDVLADLLSSTIVHEPAEVAPTPLALPPAATQVTTIVRKGRAPRKPTHVERGGKPGRLEESNAKRVHDLAGFRIGSFVGVKPTGEKYFGQIVWRFKCDGCGATKDYPSQLARRAKQAPKCKCSLKAAPSPKAERPTPAVRAPAAAPPRPVPAEPAGPEPFFARRAPVTDMTGETIATFRCVGKAPERRGDGMIVWVFRCSECGAEKRYSRTDVNRVRGNHRGFACECQKPKKEKKEWSGRGRPPEHIRLQRERDILEKPVDDLTEDELEAATLEEFARDRSLPSLRRGEERREPGSLLDEPDDDEDTEPEHAAGDDD